VHEKFAVGQLVRCLNFTNVYMTCDPNVPDKFAMINSQLVIIIDVHYDDNNNTIINAIIPELCRTGWIIPANLRHV